MRNGVDFAQGVAFHQAGRLVQAEAIYRAVLKLEPGHFDAMHFLGVVLMQKGEPANAEKQIRRAIKINPSVAAAHAHRGIALSELCRYDEALASFDAAIAIDSANADTHVNRGAALHLIERFDQALADYDRAIALSPTHAGAFNNRGNTLRVLKRYDAALTSFDAAIAHRPTYAEAFNNRGAVLNELKQEEAALEDFDRAIAIHPYYPEAYSNRGDSLRQLGRAEEALASYDRAISLKPNYAKAFNNRGLVLRELNCLDEALASFQHAIEIDPNLAEAYHNRGCHSLSIGRMREGWTDYEHRWRMDSFDCARPSLPAPHWSGENLKGRSILIYPEQGFGDLFQFSRYLPLLASQGAKVSFLIRPMLLGVFAGLPGDIGLLTSIAAGDYFDFQCALMSLPHIMGTELATVPSAVPYIRADAARCERWREKLGPAGFKIGVCWQGASDITRAIPLREFRRLSQLPGIRLISLQKHDGLEQLAVLPMGMTIETVGDDFDAGPDAFCDTVAVMEQLDLIVTCDTSIAHLAGALGRPVWLALKYSAEWRWMLDRSDSPWYPTMRLFRQVRRGEWNSVFENMAEALLQFRSASPDGRFRSELVG